MERNHWFYYSSDRIAGIKSVPSSFSDSMECNGYLYLKGKQQTSQFMLFTLVSIRKIPCKPGLREKPEENKSEKLPKLNLIPVLGKNKQRSAWIETETWTPAIGQGLQKSVPVILWAIPWRQTDGISRGLSFPCRASGRETQRVITDFPKLFHLVISHYLMKQERIGWR